MSGPGGPASSAVMMAPPTGGGIPAQDMQRIKANVYRMLQQGASEEEVDTYLRDNEGTTPEALKGSPVASPGQITGATPEAKSYNPTLLERASDLFRARQTGTGAPSLPSDASGGLQALDAFDTFNRGVDVTAHGMTGGLTDEAAGLGAATATQIPGSTSYGRPAGAAYTRASQAENANINRFQAQNPKLGAGLEGVGLVTSPLFRVGEAAQKVAPSFLGRVVRGGAQGAGAGGVTGFGYSQGDVWDKAKSAAFGAVTGGALGAAAVPLVEGSGGFASAVAARRSASGNARQHALDLLAKNMGRDRLSGFPAEGETLATHGGPNVQGLARATTAAPGNARAVAQSYFDAANEARYETLGTAAKSNVSGKKYLGTIEELDAAQKEASGPAYQIFYHVDPERFDSPFFSNLVQSKEGQDLLGKAYKIAALEKARGEIAENPMQYLLDAEGNPSTRQALSPRAVDYVKQALDQEVEAFIDPLSGRVKGPLGYQWDQLRRKFISEADKASTVDGVSLYQQAREAYSGPEGLKEAVRQGTEAFGGGKLTSEKIAAFNQLPPAKQDAFRIGLAERIVEDAGKMGPNTDPLSFFLKGGDKGNRAQLIKTYLSDPEAYDSFVQALQRESRKVQAQRTIMGGSPTSRIDAEKADAALEGQLAVARDFWRIAMGSAGEKISGFAGAARRLKDKTTNAARGINEPVANELGPLLFNPSAADNQRIMADLYARALGGGSPPRPALPGSLGMAKALLAGPTRPGAVAAPGGALTGTWGN